MPRVGVVMVRTALVQLAAGTVLGALVLAGKGAPELARAAALRPLHVEMALPGWLLQLVFGVAAWILPRRPAGARGPGEGALWLSWALLNAGVLAAGLGGMGGAPGALAPLGRLLELAAAALFAAHAWPRVRGYGALLRPLAADPSSGS
jgi:hypothetical protein